MNEIDELWKKNQELTDKLKGNKKGALVSSNPKLNPSTLNDRMHRMGAELDGLSKMIDQVKGDLDVAQFIFKNATYIVDYGNIDGKKNRETFPCDFLGALQYFGYISGMYDWAEILMSVNISFNQNYINHKRKIEKLRRMEVQNEKLNSNDYEKD